MKEASELGPEREKEAMIGLQERLAAAAAAIAANANGMLTTAGDLTTGSSDVIQVRYLSFHCFLYVILSMWYPLSGKENDISSMFSLWTLYPRT
jgi:hypothetical protein